MAELHRMEHPTNPKSGGVLFSFRSDLQKIASFTDLREDTDVVALAKDMAARVLQALLDSGEVKEAESVNWVSVVAGVSRHVADAKSRLGT